MEDIYLLFPLALTVQCYYFRILLNTLHFELRGRDARNIQKYNTWSWYFIMNFEFQSASCSIIPRQRKKIMWLQVKEKLVKTKPLPSFVKKVTACQYWSNQNYYFLLSKYLLRRKKIIDQKYSSLRFMIQKILPTEKHVSCKRF